MRVSENFKPVSLSVMLKIIHHSHQWSSGGRGSRSGATLLFEMKIYEIGYLKGWLQKPLMM